MKRFKMLIGVITVAILVMLDQFTKVLAKNNLENTDGIAIIKGVFRLQYLENKGAAFGIMKDQYFFFVLITICLLIFISYFYFKIPNEKKYYPLNIILLFMSAGAIGNMIDRVLNNYVIDFLYFELINFPIFNLADCYVTVSAFILIFLYIFYYKESDLDFLSSKKKMKNEVEDNDIKE